jgi:hypothetical protein
MFSFVAVHHPVVPATVWKPFRSAIAPDGFCDITKAMGKSIRDIKKSRPKIGRPKSTGIGQPMLVRMHDQQIADIDAWIAAQDGDISRPEAIRRLAEIGLSFTKK